MQITLTPDQALALRSIGAKINGAFGGLAKSNRKAKASRRNGKASGGRPRKSLTAHAA